MEIIKWRKAYEIGVKQMDDQHKQLIHLINQMYLIIRDKEGYETLDGILTEMSNYAQNHFIKEENLLQEHGYPDVATQQKSHQQYNVRMEQLQAEMAVDRVRAAQDIYTFLRRWWIDHIVREDMAYSNFLQEKGVD